MNWKRRLRITDVDPTDRFELTCKKCKRLYYMTSVEILKKYPEMKQFWLDEVERDLKCITRLCRGDVGMVITHQLKVEGFVGGMA